MSGSAFHPPNLRISRSEYAIVSMTDRRSWYGMPMKNQIMTPFTPASIARGIQSSICSIV